MERRGCRTNHATYTHRVHATLNSATHLMGQFPPCLLSNKVWDLSPVITLHQKITISMTVLVAAADGGCVHPSAFFSALHLPSDTQSPGSWEGMVEAMTWIINTRRPRKGAKRNVLLYIYSYILMLSIMYDCTHTYMCRGTDRMNDIYGTSRVSRRYYFHHINENKFPANVCLEPHLLRAI